MVNSFTLYSFCFLPLTVTRVLLVPTKKKKLINAISLIKHKTNNSIKILRSTIPSHHRIQFKINQIIMAQVLFNSSSKKKNNHSIIITSLFFVKKNHGYYYCSYNRKDRNRPHHCDL